MGKYSALPDATVLVGSWSSHCNNCGKPCSYTSKTHDVILGYGEENGSPGCGIEWKFIFSEYGPSMEHVLVEDRPDLELIQSKAVFG